MRPAKPSVPNNVILIPYRGRNASCGPRVYATDNAPDKVVDLLKSYCAWGDYDKRMPSKDDNIEFRGYEIGSRWPEGVSDKLILELKNLGCIVCEGRNIFFWTQG